MDKTFLERFSSQYRWKVAPAKRRFRYRKQVNTGMGESRRLALTMRGVVDRSLDDRDGLQASDYSTYQIFERGDLAFKLIDLENIKTSRVGLVPRRGIMSPAYVRLVPNHGDANSRFYAWFFFAVYFNNIFNGLGGGVRQNLTPTDLLEFPIPLPDLATQRRIANFLDHETARIDMLIEKKARLVKLLEAKRKAMVSKAVTQGLNHGVPCSSSVVNCRSAAEEGCVMGETFLERFSSQYRWNVAPAKRRFRYRKQINKGMYECRRLALTMQGVVDRSLDDLDGLQASDYSTYQIFERGDLAFKLIDLENIRTSRVGLVPRRGIMSPAYIRLVPKKGEANSRFYAWFFFAVYSNNIFNGLGGGVRQNLTRTDLLEFPIPLPDLATQRRIADFLDRQTAIIDQVIEKIITSIDRLKEYRSAVITAGVMGQSDMKSGTKFATLDCDLEAIR